MMKTVTGLAPLHVSGRLDRLRERFAGLGVDALLVTRLPNTRYLTGFTGSAAMLLVFGDDALLVSDGRYGEQARTQLSAAGVDVRVEIRMTLAEQRAALVSAATSAGHGRVRIGLEDHPILVRIGEDGGRRARRSKSCAE